MEHHEKILVRIENVEVGYEEKTVLSQVNLTIYEKDFLGIIGPNGGGKTTLIKSIMGLKDVQKGQISFFKNGSKVGHIGIGYLPQYNRVDKNFPISVEEVVLSGLDAPHNFWKKYTGEQLQQASTTIKKMGLEGLEKRAIGTLSGGQMQRTLLARAVVSQPDLLILDEPDTYIDKRFEAHLYDLLTEINKESAIILVSHDIGSVIQNVRSIACVNETVDYHPQNDVSEDWIQNRLGCPIDLIGHGDMPHRVLKNHQKT